MKISGFTFVKNAVKYEYPVVASIRSLLPIVDEMIVCLGDSEDETNKLIESIDSEKIKIIHSVWDKSLREGGRVLAVETDKAMDATATDSDWLFYIQADEVVHEKYYPVILDAMQKYKDDKRIEGLLFNYHHFYGSYSLIGDGRKWYSKEIRVIRNGIHVRSWMDAQGFRINGRKLRVKLIKAYIYHYGWVRNPVVMLEKQADFGNLWCSGEAYEQSMKTLKKAKTEFDYTAIDSVTLFEGTHPAVMKDYVENENWTLNIDVKKKNFKNIKHRVLYFLWQHFNWRPFEYSNYKRI
jgi:hypothetical protein